MASRIKPLGKRLLVKREEATVSKGGILLPDTAKEKPRMGEVIAVGPGHYEDNGRLIPVKIKVGQKVLFGSYAGTEVKESTLDEGYLILNEDEVLATLEG